MIAGARLSRVAASPGRSMLRINLRRREEPVPLRMAYFTMWMIWKTCLKKYLIMFSFSSFHTGLGCRAQGLKEFIAQW